jgi:large subunit ribosomal protein L4
LVRGAKNLARSQWLAPEGLNVYDILRHDVLVLTQAAAQQVTEALKAGAKSNA